MRGPPPGLCPRASWAVAHLPPLSASPQAYICSNQIMGWGEKAIEIRSVETGHLDGVFMHKRAQRLKFLCERNDKVGVISRPGSCTAWAPSPPLLPPLPGPLGRAGGGVVIGLSERQPAFPPPSVSKKSGLLHAACSCLLEGNGGTLRD